jgi:hypothetical protein
VVDDDVGDFGGLERRVHRTNERDECVTPFDTGAQDALKRP